MENHFRVIYAYLSRNDGESDLVALARQIATQAHAGQKRKRSFADYIIHPTRISARLRGAGASEIAQAAALLHDVIEDTHITEEDLREMFPPQVVEFVKALSKWWPDGASYEGLDVDQKKYEEQIKAHQDTMMIKLHDISDNLDEDRRTLLKWVQKVNNGDFINNNDGRKNILSIRRSLFRFNKKNKPFAEELVSILSSSKDRHILDAIKHYQYSALAADKAVDIATEAFIKAGIKTPPLE